MSDRFCFGDPAIFAVEVELAADHRARVRLFDRGRATDVSLPLARLPELAGWCLRDLSLHRSPQPLVLSGPPETALADAPLEVGHPAGARASLRAFAAWVGAGATPDAAASYVDEARFAQHVAALLERGGWSAVSLPDELLDRWDAVVAGCEAGDEDDPDELANDLAVRAAIQLALDETAPDDPRRARFASAVEQLDRRFRALLPADDATAASSRPWWQRGTPAARSRQK